MKQFALTFALVASLSIPALAQRGGGFDVPKAATMLPEASGVDAEGKPFSTRDLKRSYSVLVFGCLT